MARTSKSDVIEATKAGLRSAMVERGHQVQGQPEVSALSTTVTAQCTRCRLAVTAFIDPDADRVTVEGLKQACGGGR